MGWVDDKVSLTENDWPGKLTTKSVGAAFVIAGQYYFGTAPLATPSYSDAPASKRPCTVAWLLNMDATPGRMTVFVDGEPLAVQCEYDFPKDGRAWFPSVALLDENTALHSCAI